MSAEHRHNLELSILPQPDDTTCGPTCLQSVYHYYADEVSLDQVISDVPTLPTGGTLGVLLAVAAVRRGYSATIHCYNLHVFDPTWFDLAAPGLIEKLEEQNRIRRSPRRRLAAEAYIEFLKLGGRLKFDPLSGALIRGYLNRGCPLITGLSSSYLYRAAREHGPDDTPDDIRGDPTGHFVVLCGYDRKARSVEIADPLKSNPHSVSQHYAININRVLSSIMLGVLTYDANLIALEPPLSSPSSHA